MLVLILAGAPCLPMWWLRRLFFHLLLFIKLKRFQRELSHRLGWPVELRITYGQYYPAVAYTVPSYPVTNDWCPQFTFGFSRKRRGVLLHYLTFPGELRYRQHGRFCVEWIKQTARQLGMDYLVLGAYPEAEAFWLKMGFTRLTVQEWYQYWC